MLERFLSLFKSESVNNAFDFISLLPEPLIAEIFSYLPRQEIIETIPLVSKTKCG